MENKNNSKFPELNQFDLNGFTCYYKDNTKKMYCFQKYDPKTKLYTSINVKFSNIENLEWMLKNGYTN